MIRIGSLVRAKLRDHKEATFWLVGGEEEPDDTFWNDVPFSEGVALVIGEAVYHDVRCFRIMAPLGIGWLGEDHLEEVEP